MKVASFSTLNSGGNLLKSAKEALESGTSTSKHLTPRSYNQLIATGPFKFLDIAGGMGIWAAEVQYNMV